MNGTKGKMAEAFKELVCKKSFQKITISDIAKESAMTRENFIIISGINMTSCTGFLNRRS